ncbi:MAG: MBL fold metallo-hydrolase [Sandaracinaceae bacterium]
MELRVLGCHGGETPKHKTSSFLLDGRLAIDAGAITSMLTLEEQKKVEAVLVSHAHLDHIKDLATLADNRTQQGGPPLVISASRATLDALKTHFFNNVIWPDFTQIETPRGPAIRLHALEDDVETPLLSGFRVRAVPVHHTIDTCAFVVRGEEASVAYSGDTGPTDRLWEVLGELDDLRGLLMEVSFPDEEHHLAKVSGHHTPETLAKDLEKLDGKRDLPILLYHIKPFFEDVVERQLAQIRRRNLQICRLGEQLLF